MDVELEKIDSFYVIKEKELFDEVDALLRDVGTHDAGTSRPMPSLNSADNLRFAGAASRGARSAQSTEDGIEDSDDNDDDDDDAHDETSALNRKRRSSTAGLGRRRTVANVNNMHASTDLTASTEMTRSVWRLSTNYDEYGGPAHMAIVLKRRITSLYMQLCELKSYVKLNHTGFSKVLKKFDKICDKELRPRYMQTTVDATYCFQASAVHGLDSRIARMEQAYAHTVTEGDEAAARRDLRSHLREHVVWERNTVWRDLIGMERRAEAASVGRGLLGAPNDGMRTRLQGDDAPDVPTKEVKTPLGRLTCPTWLLGSSVVTLIGLIAVFLVLLTIPILKSPEQQNCLAMLAFVSLLWATEVR